MGSHTLDVTTATFEQEVIERSKQVPVLVDFWAPWCGPCRSLGPILEKLAEEYGGRFVLAKVNSDENQALAMDWGVRGIPSVKAFVNGEQLDEFSGALPEGLVRQFLEGIMPSPAEDLRAQAMETYRRGDGAAAMALLVKARVLDPAHAGVVADMAEILLDQAEAEAAKKLLEGLPDAARDDPRVAALIARADIALKTAGLPDAATLEQAVAANPDDLDARLKLANLHIAQQRFDLALEQLMTIVQREPMFQDEAARKTMLMVFEMLGPESKLTRDYRRRLAGALH